MKINLTPFVIKTMAPAALAFERAVKEPLGAQRKILFEFLERNKNTEYGLKYNFAGIKSIEDYQRLVPLVNCEVMRPYVERMTKGEPNILTLEKPVLFSVTSGSSGHPKFVPITKYAQAKKANVINLWAYYILRDHPKITGGKILAIVSPEVDGFTPSGVPYGAESGHGYRNLPDVVKRLYALPYEVFEIKDYDARYYTILRIAMEQNIATIATMTPSTIILLCQWIEKVTGDVINDIEKGTLKRGLDISPEIRKSIEENLRPNPKRADRLRSILAEKKELLPKYFWPRLELIECWKRGTVGLYLKDFPKYFGDVAVRDFGYFSSEARCSIPMSDEGAGGVLAVNANFYEFIPKEDIGKKEKKVLLCDRLEKGGEYFVVLTTPGGLYRYNIDDIVRVSGFFDKTPVIEFVQKGLNVTSITGEKLYESEVVEAIGRAQDRHNISIEFITASIELSKMPRYIFLVEFGKNPDPGKKKEFLKSIEKELCKISEEYDFNRKARELRDPVLKVVAEGEFERFRVKRVKEGAHDGQFKIPLLTGDVNFQKQFRIEEEIAMT